MTTPRAMGLAPARARTKVARPAITKSLPPRRWVLNQTSSDASVHGVRIPTKKLRVTLPRKFPRTAMRRPTAAPAPRGMSTGLPIAASSASACRKKRTPRIAACRTPQTARKPSKRNPFGEIAGRARKMRNTDAIRPGPKKGADRFRHVAVDLAAGVPVSRQPVGQPRVENSRDEECRHDEDQREGLTPLELHDPPPFPSSRRDR